VLVVETFGTFFLVLYILIVKGGDTTSPTDIGYLKALGIGLAHVCLLTMSGARTGGCINPSVLVAQTIYVGEWGSFFWYELATFVGGALAGLFYHYIVDAHEKAS